MIFTAPLDETLVWHEGRAVSRAGFLHAAQQLARRLPSASYCINLCNSRLAFMLGWVAAALAEQVTLLPPNQTEGAVAKIAAAHSNAITLDDNCLHQLDWHTPASADLEPDARRVMAMLYTSGSTGAPVAHAKTWQALSRTGDLDAARFVHDRPVNLVATVPGQHMFGLQTTLLLPFRSHCAIHDSRPFFPADVRHALESVPEPRALISTPAQLRVCLATGVRLPAVRFVLSATAPMPRELAARAESFWATEVLEIYGSTEAGTMATRRTTQSDYWQLLPGASIERQADGSVFHALHLPDPLPLTDHIELHGRREFRLLGRASELVKIAGKRAALGDLTQTLLDIDGVEDGAVFLPPGADRTAALVVTRTLTPAQILDSLVLHIDPVFLPRPLLIVNRLPRNEVGKLTQDALQAVLQSAR